MVLSVLGVLFLAAAIGVLRAEPPISSYRANTVLTPQQRHERAAYFASKLGLGFGVPVGARQNAIVAMRQMERRQAAFALSGVPLTGAPPVWQFIGPKPILNEQANFGGIIIPPAISSVTGRVTGIAADPLGDLILWARPMAGCGEARTVARLSFRCSTPNPHRRSVQSQSTPTIRVRRQCMSEPAKATFQQTATMGKGFSSPPIWERPGRNWVLPCSAA